MQKVKERLQKLKDDIEAAEQRETDAKNDIKELDAKVDKLGGEKTTLKSRILVVNVEYAKIQERLKDSKEKLEEVLAKTEDSEVRRKELADSEVDDYERSEEVEAALKAAQIARETADHSVTEAERKVLVLEGDLERVKERYDTAKQRVDELENRIKGSKEEICELENKDRDASERETVSEEKIKFLEMHLREMLSTAETHERNVAKLERLSDTLNSCIDNSRKARDEVARQMDELGELDMDGMETFD